ncbi:MAG: recombinase [Candidatus Marinimicrobia bacterium]|jgi:DNA repair exonuclease SbcCD nuclease subunit|nr:recombinase [Candidatus Neomarinimicrobiota bacterium]
MKIALITDTHYGARGDSALFADHMEKFYSDIFFPYLVENNIKEIIHLGDVFDRRKYVNFYTLKRAEEMFFKRLEEFDIKANINVGNHDSYFKTTIEVNSPDRLLGNRFNIINEPTTIHDSIDIIPWICDDNEDEILDFIKGSNSKYCFGHFDLAGFFMHSGIKSQYSSRSSHFLNRYEKAFSGHFHTRSNDGHIHYIGSPYETTWADFNDPKGFAIFDTETGEHEYIDNPINIFEKVVYNNGIEDINSYSNKIIKLFVKKRDSFPDFDKAVHKLDKVAVDVNIIEEIDDSLLLSDGEIEDFEAVDTLTYLRGWVEGLEKELHSSKDKKEIKSLLSEIYNEALT